MDSVDLEETLMYLFLSRGMVNSEGDDANVVDGLFAIASSIRDVAAAIRENK